MEQSQEEYKIEFLYGEKKIEIQKPYVSEELVKRRFWFDKKEYWLQYEFCRVGPFDNLKDANYYLALALAAYR